MAAFGGEYCRPDPAYADGYTDQPTEMQLLVYVAVLVVTALLMRLTGSHPTDRTVAVG
jgi:high-affinity iron transporter